MSTNLLILMTVLICAFAVAAVVELVALAKAKSIDLNGLIKKATDVYGTAETMAAVIEPFLPEPYSGILKLIFTYADKAVKAAEDAYKAGTCPEDERKAKATELIENALKMEGIAIDDKTEQLIDFAVELMVKTLPTTHAGTITAGTAAQ